MASNARDAGLADGESRGVSVSRLYREVVESRSNGTNGSLDRNDRTEAVLESVREALFDDDPFDFDESMVKGDLEEILLLLVALRDADTHGKGLMEDLDEVFDADLSPGTVYPRLHDLEEEGLLQAQELVRTKEYRIDDAEAARERVRAAMQQHLALGFFFRAALEEL